MAEIPLHIVKQLELAKPKPIIVETTPIIEEHQTTIKIPQRLRAELDLQKGDKVILEMVSKKEILLKIIGVQK